MTERLRVIIAYHHSDCTIRINQFPSTRFNVVDIIHDAGAVVQAALNLRPDVALIDVSLPLHDGFKTTAEIRRLLPDTAIFFHTLCTEALFARHAPAMGAPLVTYSKELECMAAAIMLALRRDRGETRAARDRPAISVRELEQASSRNLTERESEVLALLAGGCRMKEIAYRLGVTYRTVTFHKYQIMKKFGIHNDAALVGVALHRNIVDNDTAVLAIP